MSSIPQLGDIDVAGKRVLLRADLNVPIEDGAIEDDFRIRQSLQTVRALREAGARVIVASHLGRPGGKEDPSLSLRPIARRLGELGGFPVRFADGLVGSDVASVIDAAGDAVVVLENTRFDAGETANDPALADALAGLADIFVLDAFGTAHRAHASTVGLAERLPSMAGPLMMAELAVLDRLLTETVHPYAVVLGGAKVSDKLGVIRALLPKVDAMLIGGGMCFTLLRAAGHEIGRSLVDDALVDDVQDVLELVSAGKVMIPSDVVVADDFAPHAAHEVVAVDRIPDDATGLDIGPETAQRFAAVVADAAQLFWNGPMGVFEWEAFRNGTEAVAKAAAACDGFTVVGGGDTVAALEMFGLLGDIDHVSTGGGAGLEYLEEGSLPAVEALRGAA